jgi:multidrug efflux pump subunit AcrA (membrane-fusion protein)
MDDQEVPPAETALNEAVPRSKPADHGRGNWRPSVVILSAAVALLVTFGATMTVLYQQQAGRRAARDRTVAAQNAELDAARARLDQLQTRSDDLNALLRAAQAKALDPQGYELIKKCVQETAEEQQSIRDALSHLPDRPPLDGSHVVYLGPLETGGFTVPRSPCEDAVKYLK